MIGAEAAADRKTLRIASSEQATAQNNFNLIRMLAAVAVLVSHAYPIALGDGATEPLSNLIGISLGTLSVLTFFVISGFFISQSFSNSRNLSDFIVARVLRIYPGLLITLLLTVLLLGPIFTDLRLYEYVKDHRTLTYVFRNLSLKFLQYDLPGVFNSNPYPSAINGSLWSLYYEVVCYAGVVFVGLLGLINRRFAAVIVIYGIVYLILDIVDYRTDLLSHYLMLANFKQLTLPFVIGMSFYHFRASIRFRLLYCFIAACASLAAYRQPFFAETFVLFWSYLVFYIGYIAYRPLQLYNRLGDYSYGMYIYAFPFEQMIAAVWKAVPPGALILASFPATLLASILSWHLIESPARALRPKLNGMLSPYLRRKRLSES